MAYPGPGSKVTVTLYALGKNDPLESGKVLTAITPSPGLAHGVQASQGGGQWKTGRTKTGETSGK